jgi:hypothetical protein
MTENDHESDDYYQEIASTFEEAKTKQIELIKQLRTGGPDDQRRAEAMAICKKNYRCNMVECPVCERRKLVARNSVPSSIVKSLGLLNPVMRRKKGT